MDLKSITRFRLRRVNPFRGLVIDETTWAEAHDYHRNHQRLHALAFHSPGIAAGLEVRTGDQPATVIVNPGVALDDEGNVIVVGQARRIPIEGQSGSSLYVALAYQETRVNSDANAPRGAPANRIVESYKIEITATAPAEPTLELARFYWSGPPNSVGPARDVTNPGQNEFDLRFRREAEASRPIPVNVGVVASEADPVHMAGIGNLVREIDNVSGYRATFRGFVTVEEGDAGCDLLYVRRALDGDGPAATTVASLLARGGSVFADACSRDPGEVAIQQSIAALSGRIGLRLGPINGASGLLRSRYAFSEPPAGAVNGDIVASGRLVLSTRDYGCAWAGSGPSAALPRETIRSALEWGVNIAIASVQDAPVYG